MSLILLQGICKNFEFEKGNTSRDCNKSKGTSSHAARTSWEY